MTLFRNIILYSFSLFVFLFLGKKKIQRISNDDIVHFLVRILPLVCEGQLE
jgi:uncharacterized membrane protein YcaP (DUF421 family)